MSTLQLIFCAAWTQAFLYSYAARRTWCCLVRWSVGKSSSYPSAKTSEVLAYASYDSNRMAWTHWRVTFDWWAEIAIGCCPGQYPHWSKGPRLQIWSAWARVASSCYCWWCTIKWARSTSSPTKHPSWVWATRWILCSPLVTELQGSSLYWAQMTWGSHPIPFLLACSCWGAP